MSAESAEAFLAELGGKIDWQTMAALKNEVDRLVGVDLHEAELFTTRAEQLAELTHEPVSKAFAQAGRARVLYFQGRHAESNAVYDGVVSALRAGKLASEAAFARMQQSGVLVHLGRSDEALRAAREARRVLARGDSTRLAQVEANIGSIYYRLDRYTTALKHFDNAAELIAGVDDKAQRAFVDFGRSNVLIEKDRPAEALELLEGAAVAFNEAGQSLFAAHCQFHAAYIQFSFGNFNTALTRYYQTRKRLEELGNIQSVAWCDMEIAEILLALNAFEDCAESAEGARSRFEALGLPYESAQARVVRALALMGLRQFDQARDLLNDARSVFDKDGNTVATAQLDSYLAELAIETGDAREAATRAKAALRIFARHKLSTRAAFARLLAARVAYLSEDRARSLRMALSALKTVEKVHAQGLVHRCHHLIGKNEKARGHRRSALESFRRAVESVEQMRGGIVADELKSSFLRDKIEIYEDAINACLDEGTPEHMEEAFRLVESSKSRALADLLSRYLQGAQQSAEATGESETRARLLGLVEELNWYNSRAGLEDDKGNQRNANVAERYRREVRRCERQIAQLFRQLELEDPAFAKLQFMQAASVSELRDSLGDNETAIEYFITGDEVSAFVATRDSVRLARGIASSKEIEQTLAALRFQIEKFNFGAEYVDTFFGQLKRATDDHLSQMYDQIFAPIKSMIDTDGVVIVPHGALHYVPFHALRAEGRYLVDTFEISYVPSAAVLKLCRAVARPESLDGKMVALGVTHSDTPEIAEEIRGLGTLFPDSVTLIGDDATRENLFRHAPDARFLHLASHGYFRRDNPMFSFLKLADSPLNFYSLLDLKLRAEMVTLSACHTGVNMVFPGDELHGLMRGFLYAGAPSLVASLWAVSDASTAELMREMYARIRDGESKRRALRMAQLKIKDDYGHPYYWAPFVLMGNPA
jgi:CHAT domain-containing protein